MVKTLSHGDIMNGAFITYGLSVRFKYNAASIGTASEVYNTKLVDSRFHNLLNSSAFMYQMLHNCKGTLDSIVNDLEKHGRDIEAYKLSEFIGCIDVALTLAVYGHSVTNKK